MVSIVPRGGSSTKGIEPPLASLRTSDERKVSMWLLSSPGDHCWTLHNHWPDMSWRCIRRPPRHQTPSQSTSTPRRSSPAVDDRFGHGRTAGPGADTTPREPLVTWARGTTGPISGNTRKQEGSS